MAKKRTTLIKLSAHVAANRTIGTLRLTVTDGLTPEQATQLLLGAVASINPGLQDAAEAVYADGALADQLYTILDAHRTPTGDPNG